jgi:hypothetical protein
MPDNRTNPPVPDIAVQTTALTRKFGDMAAVDDVTLTINRSEIFGRIGRLRDPVGHRCRSDCHCGADVPADGLLTTLIQIKAAIRQSGDII